MEQHRIQVPRSSYLENFGFYFFEKERKSCSSNYSLESLFLFQILTKAMLLPSFLLSFNHAYVELRKGVKRHACFACFAESKTRSKKKQVINLDQDVQVYVYIYIYIFFLGGWCLNSFS